MKETFLELHERLLNHGLDPEFNFDSELRYQEGKAGLCALRFNNDFFSGDQIVSSYFNLSNVPTMDQIGEYTPDRQNIVLLCAAINGEL